MKFKYLILLLCTAESKVPSISFEKVFMKCSFIQNKMFIYSIECSNINTLHLSIISLQSSAKGFQRLKDYIYNSKKEAN